MAKSYPRGIFRRTPISLVRDGSQSGNGASRDARGMGKNDHSGGREVTQSGSKCV